MPYYPIEFELQENRVVMNNPILSIDVIENGTVDFNCDTYDGYLVFGFTVAQLRELADSAEELERTALQREQRTRAEFATPGAKMRPCVCDKYPCECSEF